MDGDSVDGCFHSFQRSVVLWIDWYPFKLIQSVPAVYHLPKHRVPWREKCKDQMFTRTFWSSAHLRSRDGWGAYVRNHWLPLEFGPELAIERTPLVLCFKSSLISSWCYRFGLNEETPQWSGVGGMVAQPDLKFPSPNALSSLSRICWVSCLNHETLGRCYLAKQIQNPQDVPWCSLWTCNCCSNQSHTRPRNFHMSGGKIQN